MINIYGKGGHAKVINSILWNKHPHQINFYDDEDFDSQEGLWVIAIGNNSDRKRIAEEVLGEIEYAKIIAESALVQNIEIGEGSQSLHRSVIQVGTQIGKHCIVNTAASIDHDCILGDFTFIGPNSTLCGGVRVGEGSFIGAGATILPYVRIGKNCTIGAGAVVTKNIEDGVTAYGNPAKIK